MSSTPALLLPVSEEAETWGAYYSAQNAEIFETRTNGMEIFWEKFQKIRELSNFRKANHSTENSGNSGLKVKWNGNFQGIPHEVVLFFRNYANYKCSTQR